MYGYKEKCYCEVDFKGYGRFVLLIFFYFIELLFIND